MPQLYEVPYFPDHKMKILLLIQFCIVIFKKTEACKWEVMLYAHE